MIMQCVKSIKALIPRAVYSVIKSILYAGNQVECPICGGHFRKYLPRGSRQGVFCPRCGAKERLRLLWLYLKNRTNLFSDKLRVLHFAPEPILQKKLKSMANLEYTSADLASPHAMIKLDIREITFEDNCFDAIICVHVLEHIIEEEKALSELYRVLKPGGWAIIHVPLDVNRESTYEDPEITSPQERQRVFGQDDHVRVYGRDYKDRLEKVGFNVKVDGFVRTLEDGQVERYGLTKQEDIYFCTKNHNSNGS